MRVAAVQLTSTPDKERNLATAAQLIAEAADAGAELVALPELFNCWGSARELREGAEPLDGPTITWARTLATTREHHRCSPAASSSAHPGTTSSCTTRRA